jgi:hypothetical protein
MSNKKGQMLLEYACFIAVFIGAITVMSTYIKRGIQGNWQRNTAEAFSDFYDPTKTKESSPLNITVSNVTIGISEAGRGNYTVKSGVSVSWLGKDWKIWSR